LENKDGDVEWRLNQYTRTSRKKDYLWNWEQKGD
jgi:U3 small nucleolar ribonucleoprotein protein IMP4